jgi:hypothetical protein
MKTYQRQIYCIGLFSLLIYVAGLCAEPQEKHKEDGPTPSRPTVPGRSHVMLQRTDVVRTASQISSFVQDRSCSDDDEGENNLNIPPLPNVCSSVRHVQSQLSNLSIKRSAKRKEGERKDDIEKRLRKTPITPQPNPGPS